jgi:hypothetical protein
MKIRKWSLILILFFGGLSAQAQQYLYLKKAGTAQLKRIGIGDPLWINTTDEGSFFISGRLTSVRSDMIHLDNQPFRILEIRQFRTYSNDLLTLSSAMKWSSALLAGLMLVNSLGGADQGPIILPGVLIGASIGFSSSFIVKGLARKTYRVQEGWRVEVIDFKQLERNDESAW